MKKWKKWLVSVTTAVSLFAVPVGMASAANAVQTLLYGAAAMTLAKQQLMHMDNNNQKQMLAATMQKTGVTLDGSYNNRLETIKKNLVQTGMIKRSYDVYTNPSKELNAFETIGGVISVNKGMMDTLNDDELAFTLCHEMQHGEKRHAINGVVKSIGISYLVDIAFGGHGELLDVLLGSLAVNYIDNELITMDQEKEADAYGFQVMKNTQYNVGGAPASMQYVYEKYGELYTEGFKRVISPNNHPKMTPRIEKLGMRMAKWSGNHVQVGGGTVYVNAKPVVTPAPTGDYSTRRRAFLVAGNLARVTHDVYGETEKDNKVVMTPMKPEGTVINSKDKMAAMETRAAKQKDPANLWNVQQNGNDISVNGLRIMTCVAGDDSMAITKNLTDALNSPGAMKTKKELMKEDKEWNAVHGYKSAKSIKDSDVPIPRK